MTDRFKGKRLRLLAASGLLATGLVAAALTSVTASTASASSSKVAASSSTPLVMESSPETSVTDNFNPFISSSAASLLGASSLIYESMLQFDVAAPTQRPYDFLATGYTWGANGKSITFAVRAHVKFSNGTAMTPADVAFTYGMLKQYPDVNVTGLPITGTSVSGQNVTITFSSSQYTNLQNIAGVYIVPQSIWSTVGDPAKYIVTDPIGTGPYVLGSFTPEGFTLTANTSYWGGPWNIGSPPKVSTVEFPALTSNNTVLSELVSNQLDWAGNFITGLQKAFVSGHPNHKVWFAPVNTVTLYPNLTVWPTDQLAVREAISLAINRNTLSSQGESGFEPPATNASGLTLPNFNALISPSVAKMTLTNNVAEAKAVLKAAGFTLNKSGWFEKNGKVVALSVTDPAAYSDYAADDAIVATELKAAGIDATFIGQSVSAWGTDIGNGDYQLTTHWGQTSISAYQLYNYWLNSSLYTSSPTNVAGDYERLNSKAMDADLTTLASATTVAEQKADLAPIEEYVATQLPVIPTLYGAAFDEYNTSSFTGWPSTSDPYESGSPNRPTNEVVVLHLTPTS
jgi:peptide/nickel transport system substrate-binding protein